jgi:hypothetical protein
MRKYDIRVFEHLMRYSKKKRGSKPFFSGAGVGGTERVWLKIVWSAGGLELFLSSEVLPNRP